MLLLMAMPARWASASLATVSNASSAIIHVYNVIFYIVIFDCTLLENKRTTTIMGICRHGNDHGLNLS